MDAGSVSAAGARIGGHAVTFLADLDTRLFVLLNREWTNAAFDFLMPLITDFDHWRIPVILLLLVVLARGKAGTRVGVLFAILAVVAADQICSSAIKPLFDRPRPFRTLEAVRQLVDAHSSSFPSSHAANTFAAGVFLAIRFRKLRPILVVPAVVAYSRVYVGVHYPFDVLAGGVLGAAIGAGFAVIERAARLRFRRRRAPGRRGARGAPNAPESEQPLDDEGDGQV